MSLLLIAPRWSPGAFFVGHSSFVTRRCTQRGHSRAAKRGSVTCRTRIARCCCTPRTPQRIQQLLVKRHGLLISYGSACVLLGATSAALWTAGWQQQKPLQCKDAVEDMVAQVVASTEVPDISKQILAAELGIRKAQRCWQRWLRMLRRSFALLWYFGPVFFITPTCLVCWHHGGEDMFWRWLLAALEASGPAFIKLAQWASTRKDIFPETVTRHLAALQAAVQPHSFNETKEVLTDAFGPSWIDVLMIQEKPVGSGCIAQVHRGWLQRKGEPRIEVAVKVCHPGAMDKVRADIELIRAAAQTLEWLWTPLKNIAILDAVNQFEAFILPQCDLRHEASNLCKFLQNFPYSSTGKGLRVRVPTVMTPFVTQTVLIETFERAEPLSNLLDNIGGQQPHQIQRMKSGGWAETFENVRRISRQGQLSSASSDHGAVEKRSSASITEERRRHLGRLCMDAFLQMLFVDNFIHGDMHPGNLLYRDDGNGANIEFILLDAGLAVEMSKRDQTNFLDLLRAITLGSSRDVGRLMAERTPGRKDLIVDSDGFISSIARLVDETRSVGLCFGKLRFGDIIGEMLSLACRHRVKVEANFVTVAISIIVLEGVGRQLDPKVDLLQASVPHLMRRALASDGSTVE